MTASVTFCPSYAGDDALVCAIHELALGSASSVASEIVQIDTPLAAEKRLPRFVKSVLATIKNGTDGKRRLPMIITMSVSSMN